MIELAPSLLAADSMRLGEEIGGMLEDGVSLLHYDVMDAHFVPNLSFGPALLEQIHGRFPACRQNSIMGIVLHREHIQRIAGNGEDVPGIACRREPVFQLFRRYFILILIDDHHFKDPFCEISRHIRRIVPDRQVQRLRRR